MKSPLLSLLFPLASLALCALPGSAAQPKSAAAPRVAFSDLARSAKPWLEQSEIFVGGVGDYPLYRIPGLAVTARGTLLAFCDARKNPRLGDWSGIDICLRRSTDGGVSWGMQSTVIHLGLHAAMGIRFARNETAVAQKLGAADQMPINNQLPIADRNGAVHLLHCVNYARAFYQRSDDDGVTFSAPVEITKVFEEFRPEYAWKVIATGPNHGIQLAYSGRNSSNTFVISTGAEKVTPSSSLRW